MVRKSQKTFFERILQKKAKQVKNEKMESLKFKWRGFSAPAGRFKQMVCRGENAMRYLRFMKKKGAKKWEECYNVSTEGAKKRRAAPKKNE